MKHICEASMSEEYGLFTTDLCVHTIYSFMHAQAQVRIQVGPATVQNDTTVPKYRTTIRIQSGHTV